ASFTNSAFVFYRLMHSLERVGKLEEAVRVGEDFLKSCSWEDFDEKVFRAKIRSIYVKLGNKFRSEGNRSKAEEFFEKAKRLE
ncbi:MAG: hypothetical protein ABDH28_08015, partial [Brevinematia bacterium]